MSSSAERETSGDNDSVNTNIRREGSLNRKLVSERSRTLQWIHQYKPIQIWDWLFKSIEVHGKILVRDGLVKAADIEECFLKGNSKKLSIKLPTWTVLQCLLASAKSNSTGLVISDDVELTKANMPRDKVFEWFIEPLWIIKEQIKKLQLLEAEEACLNKLVMSSKYDTPEVWDEIGFPSSDDVKRAQLQGIIRRLQGIVSSMSRMPTFRRRFRNLVKVLYLELLQAGASNNHIGGTFQSGYNGKGAGSGTEIESVSALDDKLDLV